MPGSEIKRQTKKDPKHLSWGLFLMTISIHQTQTDDACNRFLRVVCLHYLFRVLNPLRIRLGLRTILLIQILRPIAITLCKLGNDLAEVLKDFAISTSQAVTTYFPSGFNSTLNVAGAYLYIAPVELSVVEPKNPPKIMLPQKTGSKLVSATTVLVS